MTHDFHNSLAWSDSFRDAPWWSQVYQQAFGTISAMVSVDEDGWAQRAGIDRMVILPSGRHVTVDEKVREKDWPDLCLERWSDRDRRKPGWVQKPLDCDYIAYAFVPSRACYLLPTLDLQRAWRLFGRRWIARAETPERSDYRLAHADNGRYVTQSVCVPINDVLAAMQSSMRVEWSDGHAVDTAERQ